MYAPTVHSSLVQPLAARSFVFEGGWAVPQVIASMSPIACGCVLVMSYGATLLRVKTCCDAPVDAAWRWIYLPLEQGVDGPARRTADEGDDVEHLVSRIVRALAQLDVDLAPPGNGVDFGQRLEIARR
jgi:hypothetical protein